MAILDLFAFLLVLINSIVIPLIFTAAFLLFLIGVFKYFFTDGGKGREEGRKFIVSAVAGFFFMIAIWGLVNLVVNTFGFNQVNRPALPYFGGSNSGTGGFGNGGVSGPRSPSDCPPGTLFLRNAGGVQGNNECRPIPD